MFVNKNKYVIVSVIIILLLSFAPKLAVALNVNQFKLYNGLEFYLIKTNNPVITYATWVNAGGTDENNGKQGVAHFVEHMMFKDNKKYTGAALTAALQSTGGIYNAFTNYDFTVYYETVPFYYLPLVMKLEASRIHGLSFKKEQFTEERKVILEERGLRIDNNPIAKFTEIMNYYTLPGSNYGRSLIGSKKDIESISINDLEDFYRTYYVPSNIKIFVIGNISFKQFKRLALKYYNNIPKAREQVNNYNITGDTAYGSNVAVSINDKTVIQPIYSISYLAPNLKNSTNKQQVLALLLLKQYLSSTTNIFYNSLVKEKNLVNDLMVNYEPLTRLNNNFAIYFIPKEGVNFNTVKNEANLLLSKIAKNGIDDKELQILYNQFKSNLLYTKSNDSSFLLLFANLVMTGFTINNINSVITELQKPLDYKQINGYITNFLTNNKMYLELNN